jgi:hypothetical protein
MSALLGVTSRALDELKTQRHKCGESEPIMAAIRSLEAVEEYILSSKRVERDELWVLAKTKQLAEAILQEIAEIRSGDPEVAKEYASAMAATRDLLRSSTFLLGWRAGKRAEKQAKKNL